MKQITDKDKESKYARKIRGKRWDAVINFEKVFSGTYKQCYEHALVKHLSAPAQIVRRRV